MHWPDPRLRRGGWRRGPTRITRFAAMGKPYEVRKMTVTVENAVRLALTRSRTAVIEDFVGEAYSTPPLSARCTTGRRGRHRRRWRHRVSRGPRRGHIQRWPVPPRVGRLLRWLLPTVMSFKAFALRAWARPGDGVEGGVQEPTGCAPQVGQAFRERDQRRPQRRRDARSPMGPQPGAGQLAP